MKGSQPEKAIAVDKHAVITGAAIRDANWTKDDVCHCIVITLRLNDEAAGAFAQLTQANVGRRLAVVLGNEVLTAPNIREPILGGTMQIQGDFTIETANELASLLRLGALPAPYSNVRCQLKRPGGHWEPCPGMPSQ